jgi:hypothetical protein
MPGRQQMTDHEPEADTPWPFSYPTPIHPEGWVDEIAGAYRTSSIPPRVVDADGLALQATTGCNIEAAVFLALHTRGVTPSSDSVRQLIATIHDMSKQLQDEGPQWELLKQIPALGFSITYVWTHLGIGAISEDDAAMVMEACSGRVESFPAPLPTDAANKAVSAAASRS